MKKEYLGQKIQYTHMLTAAVAIQITSEWFSEQGWWIAPCLLEAKFMRNDMMESKHNNSHTRYCHLPKRNFNEDFDESRSLGYQREKINHGCNEFGFLSYFRQL